MRRRFGALKGLLGGEFRGFDLLLARRRRQLGHVCPGHASVRRVGSERATGVWKGVWLRIQGDGSDIANGTFCIIGTRQSCTRVCLCDVAKPKVGKNI